MRNQDTWDEANRYFPNIMLKVSIVSIFIGILCFYFMRNSEGFMIAIIIPVVLLFYVIYATEKHLKKMFDENKK